MSRRHPVTIGTSRTESRSQAPSDSGSNTRDRLNAVESIVANMASDQRLGAPQHELGSTPPSGRSVRPPYTPYSGCASAKSSSARSDPGSTRVSGLSSSSHEPVAERAPRFTPRAKPRFSPASTITASGNRDANAAALPSVEPLSTTTSSRSTADAACTTERRHADVASLVL
jgi:hypothetical protein